MMMRRRKSSSKTRMMFLTGMMTMIRMRTRKVEGQTGRKRRRNYLPRRIRREKPKGELRLSLMTRHMSPVLTRKRRMMILLMQS